MHPQPFISFYTPTYRRPQQLAACMASVANQTYARKIEQVIIPDHVGLGIAGMYEQVPLYKEAMHGRYVHFLADDDILPTPLVVERLHSWVERWKDEHAADLDPEVIIVSSEKNGQRWPHQWSGEPVCGAIDLGCFVVRTDIWKKHANDYGKRYEGDYDFIKTLWNAGYRFCFFCELVLVRGAVSRGAPEWTP